MTARVDVRRLDTRFSAMLLQFTRVAGAVLVRRDGLVVEPLVGAFGAAFAVRRPGGTSDQRLFCVLLGA
jgi:hypothetical protein